MRKAALISGRSTFLFCPYSVYKCGPLVQISDSEEVGEEAGITLAGVLKEKSNG